MAAGTVSKLTIIILAIGSAFILVSGTTNLFSFATAGLNLPPPPPGTSLSDILNAPLFGDLIKQAAAKGGPNLIGIATFLALNAILNTVFFASSFIISGYAFGKLFHRLRTKHLQPQPSEDAMPKPASPPAPPPSTTPAPTVPVATILPALLLVLLTVGAVLPAGFAQGVGSSGTTAGEQLALDLQKDGSLHMTYSTNVTSLPGVPTDYSRVEFQSLQAAAIFSRNGTVQNGQNGFPSYLLSLLPRNGFLAAYQVSDPSVGKTRADILASEFGQGFNVSLQSTTSLVLPSFGGQNSGNVYLAIYQCQQDATMRILPLAQANGVGTILTPAKVFVSNYAITAGYLNFGNSNVTLSASVAIAADLTPLGNFYGRGTFTLGLRETFGGQGTIGPSTTAKTTNIQLSFPANTTVVAYGPASAKVNPTQGQYQLAMNITSPSTPNAYVTFDATFPQHITIGRQTDPSSPVSAGTTVTEKVTVTNLGNQTIHGVSVSEKKLFQTYPTLELLSASYNVTLGDIDPQALREATEQFKVGSDGIYMMPPAAVSYTDQNQTVSKESSQTTLVSTFNLQLYLGKLVSGTAPYSYPLLLLIVLAPIREVIRQVGRLSARRRKKLRQRNLGLYQGTRP